MALTLKTAGALVQQLPAHKKGNLMKVKILNQIFVYGDLANAGDVLEVDEATAISLVQMKEAEHLPDDYEQTAADMLAEAEALRKAADELEKKAAEKEASEEASPTDKKPASDPKKDAKKATGRTKE